MDRLDKLISHMGQYSRSEIKNLIRIGQITVNGMIATKEDMKVDGDKDQIIIKGNPLNYEKYTYLMLNKPAGVLTATEDKNQKTVLDILPKSVKVRDLAPVGRLDKDAEGLLILTNDGVLAHDLLSPKKHVNKTYYVETDLVQTEEDVDAFRNGIQMENGETFQSAQLHLLGGNKGLVTIHEGKFHQVKKMMLACGKRVTYLKRLSMGKVELDDQLQPGEFRYLSNQEINLLKKQGL